MDKVLRAATYSRYSCDQQRETSVEDQQRNVHARARQEKWKVVRDFKDAAMSGSDSKRPGYLAMLAAAGRGEFDILLIDDLSRLTRDSVEQERTIRRLEFQGIRLVATSDGYDSQSKARKMHRGMKGLMNEMFLDDLADKVHRGQKGQALKGRWNGGRPYGFRLRRLLDKNIRDQYGEPARIGTVLEVNREQAAVVREIYERYAAGETRQQIANDLNNRHVPSPGSSWKRVVRRCGGWQSSAIRVMLLNPLYTGLQRWNVSQFVRDPDTSKHLRRARPQSEWVPNQIESLRIVTDELFTRAAKLQRKASDDDVRLKLGGHRKYMLSGLLNCGSCGRRYTLADNHFYSCGTVQRKLDCDNRIRVRRDQLQQIILAPVYEDLLEPARVMRMAREMETEYVALLQARSTKAEGIPKELRELDGRLARLRTRLQDGDPDLTADEMQAAIARVEAKRDELRAMQPAVRKSARIVSMLPKMAALYRKQIKDGLDGNERAMANAHLFLRDLLGPITLTPGKKGELWASYWLNRAALVRGTGTHGRGDRI